MNTLLILVTLVAFIHSGWASNADSALQKALEKANQGQTSQAIKDLEKLRSKFPNDARLRLSLGLLYKDKNQISDAISELETAVQMEANEEGYYALGLLYEAKFIETSETQAREKAIQYWKMFLKKAGSTHPRVGVAQSRLKSIQDLQ